eukprot:CAMPEP_0183359572 /NCGR_PEP_ID=MMETSP0164_2-20130417/52611_1 /TAXON_ID=221442 /ORGANISM="Coccolithus pelagicus ssp braarudi, Strain PLY182g" /LENGTH=218 /DNA_ID=CAMNT_0025533715 /DNA_START=117 /DNA_END=774 /DNA_ORIENTATION=+
MRQHRHTTPLLAGLYPILEGEASRTFKPRSLHTSSDYVPSQAPEAAVEHSPVPTGMVGMAAVGAVGLAGILFLAMGFLLLRSIGIGMLRAPVVPDVLVAVAALLPPIGATCITIGGDLGQLSVGWYICGMLSAASYAFFVFLRMLHVHFLALSVERMQAFGFSSSPALVLAGSSRHLARPDSAVGQVCLRARRWLASAATSASCRRRAQPWWGAHTAA